MKKQFLLLLITFITFNCYSQIAFEKGYYIDSTNQKTNCLIKNIAWKNNPTEIEYKLSENSQPKKLTIASIKAFGIDNISKYVRSTVNIDRSSQVVHNLSEDKNPIFEEEVLFLKVLVEGKAILYQYVDSNLNRYFYSKDGSNIEQLIYKRYKITDNNNIGTNNRYKQQLVVDLKCPLITLSKIENVEYKKNELVRLFVKYNSCNNQEFINFEQKQKRDFFNLTIRPRLNSSSLSIQNSTSDTYNTDFGNKISLGFGIEAEYILPFNKNKWAIAIEPTYQSYKSEKRTKQNEFLAGTLIANVKYSSIEVPFTIRHYFFLNNNSKLFVNASYTIDLSSKSTIDFVRDNGTNESSIDIKTRGNAAIGVGYKQNDKYSLEIRYQANRDFLKDSLIWESKYNPLSIVFGYSLF
ncbi:outer membrane beta-barrel protein [Olleya sp. 1-3]|uniref:outer membrane beta-barrel protein n=1 Tax=Olleya sp. 1-3 TaxID=2058323 RepID=UPI000C32C826|nr:outer membrane beta-barrel protein [Olleya sp. 1-3]PKG52600.1 tRNA modification GTPase [Olleya sp. 1-3]